MGSLESKIKKKQEERDLHVLKLLKSSKNQRVIEASRADAELPNGWEQAVNSRGFIYFTNPKRIFNIHQFLTI